MASFSNSLPISSVMQVNPSSVGKPFKKGELEHTIRDLSNPDISDPVRRRKRTVRGGESHIEKSRGGVLSEVESTPLQSTGVLATIENIESAVEKNNNFTAMAPFFLAIPFAIALIL